MKVKNPDHLQGRMLDCIARSRLVADTLEAFGTSDNSEPSRDSLIALGAVAEELADELAAIEEAMTEKETDAYLSRRPKLRALMQGGVQ